MSKILTWRSYGFENHELNIGLHQISLKGLNLSFLLWVGTTQKVFFNGGIKKINLRAIVVETLPIAYHLPVDSIYPQLWYLTDILFLIQLNELQNLVAVIWLFVSEMVISYLNDLDNKFLVVCLLLIFVELLMRSQIVLFIHIEILILERLPN